MFAEKSLFFISNFVEHFIIRKKLMIYACNKNVPCGFGKVLEELTQEKELSSLNQTDAENDPLNYLTKNMEDFYHFWKRSSATNEITTAPFQENDALQLGPFCLDSQGFKFQSFWPQNYTRAIF